MWFVITAQASSITVMEGPRPARDLHAAFAARQPELQACFKGSDREVTLRIVIETDGLVASAQFGTSVGDPELARCLVSESLRMRTPRRPSDAGATTYEWKVSPATLAEPLPEEGPKPGEFSLRGALDRKAVEKLLTETDNSFQYCYRKELTRDPKPAPGKLDLALMIDAKGAVQGATVQNSTITEPRIEECVLARARGIRFPAPTDGQLATVIWPISLHPQEAR